MLSPAQILSDTLLWSRSSDPLFKGPDRDGSQTCPTALASQLLRQAQLEMAGLPCALALFVLLPLTGADVGGDILERGFFVGWSWKFAAMLLYWIPAPFGVLTQTAALPL